MGFKQSRRSGKYWEDAITLDKIITDHNFITTGKTERDFENGLSSVLDTRKNRFNCSVMSQVSRETKVSSVYCFGKNHRPDMTLDENGIAIEVKFVNYSGLKDAIGQGYMYRLQYRFVFLILVVKSTKKEFYEDLSVGKERPMVDMLQHLADHMNIFTYIVPSFKINKNMKRCHSFFLPMTEHLINK